MSSVVITGDTSGAITLAAPAVAGTNTINLPATSGTMITTGSSAALPVSAINATGTPSASTFLRGDGTWNAPAGGVTSAVAGNGISVSGATGAVTFAVACPTAGSVGSYALGYMVVNPGVTISFGSNFAAGGGSSQVSNTYIADSGLALTNVQGNNLSGTWKYFGLQGTGLGGSGSEIKCLFCRVS